MTDFRKLLIASASMLAASLSPALAASSTDKPSIVLVHGAFVDGSGWKKVADILRKDGYEVSVAQPPMTSLEDDVAATRRIIERQEGKTILVGHSYGGGIITEAGNDPKVVALVYVAAFVPDEGEALGALLESKPGASKGITASKDGYLFLNPATFHEDFAKDISKADADFMALSQMPVAAKAFGTPVTAPAWKTRPSYGIVATEDRIINPKLERTMYQRANAHVTEVKSSHSVFASQPKAVAEVIERAAKDVK